jgi:hypothetical protein
MHSTPIRHTDPTRSLLRRATAIAALGAASLALIAAVPASAEEKPPVDKNGKKSCYLKTFSDGPNNTYTMWKYLRTSHDGGLVGGTRGALDGAASARRSCGCPSVHRHLSIAPR